jgi:hypothetical protein
MGGACGAHVRFCLEDMKGRDYSKLPIIRPSVVRHSVLSDVPCRNAPVYHRSTQHVAK